MDKKKRCNGVHLALYRALTDEAPLDGEKPLDVVDTAKWQRYQVMKTMGWTFEEYQKSPARIVDVTWLMIQTEMRAVAVVMKRRET